MPHPPNSSAPMDGEAGRVTLFKSVVCDGYVPLLVVAATAIAGDPGLKINPPA